MEKFIEYLQEAEKKLRIADHMIYVTFPLVKDKKILLKIIEETKQAVANCINSILQYDYLFKRIRLYSDPKMNFQTFKEKSAPRYEITPQETKLIIELFQIFEKHKQSQMEFLKNDKIIILARDLKPETITIEKIKEFLIMAKNICDKINKKIGNI